MMKGTGFPQIIDKLRPLSKIAEEASMTHLVAAMRKDISVDEVPDAGDGRGGVVAFTISYIGERRNRRRRDQGNYAVYFFDKT